jgi:hypothetical protein
MKRIALLLLASPCWAQFTGSIPGETPPVEPPPPPAVMEQTAPITPAPEEPEDELETLINRSAFYYEKKLRAKCGGALLEAAELVQTLAQPQPQAVQIEVEDFRQLALLGARGELNPHAVDFAASRAYVRLSALFCDRAAAKFESGKLKDAGRDWYRALLFVERGIEWGGFGLKDPGIDTLEQAKIHSQGLAQGGLVEVELARKHLRDTRNMISEIGRSLSAKAGLTWEEIKDGTKSEARRVGGVVEDKSRDVIRGVKRQANRFGDALKRWGN